MKEMATVSEKDPEEKNLGVLWTLGTQRNSGRRFIKRLVSNPLATPMVTGTAEPTLISSPSAKEANKNLLFYGRPLARALTKCLREVDTENLSMRVSNIH